jgi:hypothetical protein
LLVIFFGFFLCFLGFLLLKDVFIVFAQLSFRRLETVVVEEVLERLFC